MSMMKEFRIQGSSVSEGVAIGHLFFLPSHIEEVIEEFSIEEFNLDSEVERYNLALGKSREDLLFLQFNLKEEDSNEASEIIETHIQMLEDPLMTLNVEEKIRETKKNAESVFSSVIREYEKKFSKIKDPFFQQRIVDVLDVSKRVLDHLAGKEPLSSFDVPEDSVIFTEELIPSHMATLQASRVGAFVTQQGGSSSHAALIAKAQGIPYVSNIDVSIFQKIGSSCIIVDGKSGEVIFHPEPETLKKYKELKTSLKITYQLLQQDPFPIAETLDGYPVHVYANIGNLVDLEEVRTHQPEAVGLFRSEYLFLEKNIVFLSEEEQFKSYEKIAKETQGLSVVMRVFDIGGDKNPDSFLEEQKESNPVLGCRGIRFLLRHPTVFRSQLRALMRAYDGLKLKILLPLVSDPQEVIEAKKIINQVQVELESQGLIKEQVFPVGCMIEVPSAAFLCGAMAHDVDFFSIGTNDLLQYTLGMDRGNPAKLDFFSPSHPSIIRMIKMVALEAKRHNKPVTVCGEMAANPRYIPLLIGLGIREFSCSPRYIPLVKKAVRRCTLLGSFKLAQKILQMSSSHEISQILADLAEERDRKESILF
jgi:phosphoenolpyruvate-protein phosphotransferase (PTS system enzyme I)